MPARPIKKPPRSVPERLLWKQWVDGGMIPRRLFLSTRRLGRRAVVKHVGPFGLLRKQLLAEFGFARALIAHRQIDHDDECQIEKYQRQGQRAVVEVGD